MSHNICYVALFSSVISRIISLAFWAFYKVKRAHEKETATANPRRILPHFPRRSRRRRRNSRHRRGPVAFPPPRHPVRLRFPAGCQPRPRSRRDMPLQDAARILGKSLPTLLRWIEAGKLDGRQFGNRLWLVSAESVERVRASLSTPPPAPVPAQPPAPLPDRLAHLSNRIRPR